MPAPASSVGCRVCRGPLPAQERPGAGEAGPYGQCWCCATVAGRARRADAVRWPLVVPVALFAVGSSLHRALRRYKDAPVAEARRHHAGRLAALVASFLGRHGACLEAAAGPFEALAIVPSGGRRPPDAPVPDGGNRPLEALVGRVAALNGLPRVTLRRGPRPVAHLAPDADAVEVAGPLRPGARVLLVDDTWTTGAHVLSAVLALRRAGAIVPAVLVVGRCVDPGASARVARWWRDTVDSAARSGDGCGLDRCRLDDCGWDDGRRSGAAATLEQRARVVVAR